MMLKKASLIISILFSGHAALCMEYDLCKDKEFFKSIRKNLLQNSDDPFYLESPHSTPVAQKESLSDPIDFPYFSDKSMENSSNSSSFDIEPQRKRKAPKPQHPPKRIKTTAYTITCPEPECNTTITNSSVKKVAQMFLIHKHSKSHDIEKFNEVKKYVNDTKKFVNGKWEIQCMDKDCTHKLQHVNVQALSVVLMTHLHAASAHNTTEIEEVKKSVTTINLKKKI